MPYKIIYTPNGKRMEVAQERADLLVLNEGWTQTKPEITKSVKEKKKYKPREVNLPE